MTTYKVEIVGEFEGLPCVGGADLMVNGAQIRLPDALLAVVAPPLPPEPTDLGYYFVNPDKGDGFLVERQLGDWWSFRNGFTSWEELHEDYPCLTLTRLVPEPSVESVDLPWIGDDESDADVRVELSPVIPWPGRVFVDAPSSHLLPDTADAMAAALTTAAAKARQS